MLIAILSDIHDRVKNMRLALSQARAEGCTHLLFLGDMAEMSTFRTLRQEWEHEMDLVQGNNDYPREEFAAFAATGPATRFHGASADLHLGGRRIYMAHEPGAGVLYAAESEQFDLVLFGHTHRAGQQTHANTLIANPGDIQGRYGAPSFAIYDTTTHLLRHIRL